MRLEPHRLVFIDETAVTTKMTRLRGRSARGTRLETDAPFGHWCTQTFIAGLRIDELSAPWVLDGPMNRAAFDTYIETQLAPTLQPGDVIIADNLSSHKSAFAQNILKAQGSWMLFLPPYSPDLRQGSARSGLKPATGSFLDRPSPRSRWPSPNAKSPVQDRRTNLHRCVRSHR